MSEKLNPARKPSARTVERHELRRSGAAGTHRDQNRRRGAKLARGGRQGERLAARKEVWA